MTLLLHTYSDGGARGNPGPAAIGVVLCDERGKVIQESSKSIGHRTNNQAEYEIIGRALKPDNKAGVETLLEVFA